MLKAAVILAVLAAGITYLLSSSEKLEVPTLPETNWGPEKQGKQSADIRPFTINVPAKKIEQLKERLSSRSTFVEPLEDAAWTYGISTKYLNGVLDYWKDKYNWTERQALLNKYPQFKTKIQGLDIHFYHVKPTNLPKNRNIKVLPLIMVHGWPGSVVEFQKIIPLLTTPSPHRDFVFELVVPSLPGYGFSQGAVRPGMGAAQISVIFKNLMQRLGFEKFYAQGGDWGSIIVTNMATLYPESVIGMHSNMCNLMTLPSMFWSVVGSYFPSLIVESEHYSKFYPFGKALLNLVEESGYFHIQATKPDTVGVALSSSPEGLAAYILEKFSTWTDKEYRTREDGGLTEKFALDELLDNVMVYWVTNSITTSMRLYAETMSTAYRALKIERLTVKVPTACAVFSNDVLNTPRSIIKSKYENIIQYNYLPRGGHFAALEEPQLLADDVFSFVKLTEELKAKPQQTK